MGRKKKVGLPRGRSGGRRAIGNGEGRKRRTLYCTESEFEQAKALIWYLRAFKDLPNNLLHSFLMIYKEPPGAYYDELSFKETSERLVGLNDIWHAAYTERTCPMSQTIKKLLEMEKKD